MAKTRAERRLAAILAADVAGYSRLMGNDEEGTLAALKECQKELIDPKITEHHGRIVKTIGDGFLAEFASVVDATRCAIDIQRSMADRNAAVSEDSRIDFRVGINVGDIIADGEDIFGDGVNIAARLESIAPPGEICVSEDAYKQVRGKLPIDVADMGEQQLRNIAQAVRSYTIKLDSQCSRPPPALPDRPSIAVLPFQNLSGDAEQDYFCDGVTEDIITALSRWEWFIVISRNSSFVYRDQKIDVRRVGRELGARYLVEGTLRKAGDRVRISAQLIDASNGAHLWAERFEESLTDIFAIQDEVSRRIAGSIAPTLAFSEGNRVARKPMQSLPAWDVYLQGRWLFHKHNKENRLKALTCFERAIELNPELSEAHAWFSRALYGNIVYGFSAQREEDLKRATEAARKALQLDHSNANAWRSLAQALSMAGDHPAALAAARKAIELNPSMAEAYFSLAVANLYSGDPDGALSTIDTALRISPADPQNFARLATRASALYLLKRYEEAVEVAQQSLGVQQEEFRRFPTALRVLAASYAQLGRDADAKAAIAEMLKNAGSEHSVEDVVRPFRRSEDRELYANGLRKAGFPEK